MTSIDMFISYAPEDESLRQKLYTSLKALRSTNFTFWSSRDLIAGQESSHQINTHLNNAQIILILVSPDYLSSDDLYEHQLLPAMERAKNKQARVIPILLRPCNWEKSPLGKFSPLPPDHKPVTRWQHLDSAWENITDGITAVVDNLLASAPALPDISNTIAQSTPAPSAQPEPAQHTASSDFHVFLCYNGQDREAVKNIATQLKARGLKPWLDIWELHPGFPWQRALEEQIESIPAAAVFVGQGGIGPWQKMEIDALLRAFVKRNCPVIPVLLPTAPDKPGLPVFLAGMHWVDFRTSDPDPMYQLTWGITGIRPNP